MTGVTCAGRSARLTALTLLVLSALTLGSVTAQAQADCAGAYSRERGTLVVQPSGGDDTFSIQCALDAAAQEAGLTVYLDGATFQVEGRLTANGLDGRLTGNGMADTEILVTGSGADVFRFDGGDVRVDNLAVHVMGGANYQAARPSFFQGVASEDWFGAILHFVGSSARIDQVALSSATEDYVTRPVEYGVLIDGCRGHFRVSNSLFETLKRPFMYVPTTAASETDLCTLRVSDNTFEGTYASLGFLGNAQGDFADRPLEVLIADNAIAARTETFIVLAEYPITFTENVSTESGNGVFWCQFCTGRTTVSRNTIIGNGEFGNTAILYTNSSNGTIAFNTFVDIDNTWHLAPAIWIYASTAISAHHNDYRESGVEALSLDQDGNLVGGAILVEDSNGNSIGDSTNGLFPEGMDSCDLIAFVNSDPSQANCSR